MGFAGAVWCRPCTFLHALTTHLTTPHHALLMTSPKIGIIYKRDAHPGANRMVDLTDDHGAGAMCFCDEVGVDLGDALAATYEVDAHFLLYTLLDEDGNPCWARANKKSPFVPELMSTGGRVAVTHLALDFDLHVEGTEDKRTWHSPEEITDWIGGLASGTLPEPTYFYTTKHGTRVIYALTEPVSHLEAEQLIAALIRDYAAHGYEADVKCKDWTRLFRLPKTERPDRNSDQARFYETDLFVFLSDRNQTLDPSSVEVDEVAYDTLYGDVTPYDAEAPDPEEVRELLETKTASGNPRPTDWVRKAQTMLTGRDAERVCFREGSIDVTQGWNSGVLALVGQVVTMTARQDEASAEGVYALIFSAIEQLQARDETGDTNWFELSWSMVCRMWANEMAQIDIENRQRIAEIEEGRLVKATILEKVKTAAQEAEPSSFEKDDPTPVDEVPTDPQEAEEWLQRRMIASMGKKHYVMTQEGDYNLRPVANEQLIPMIRDLGMQDVIEITELRGKTWGYKGIQQILNSNSTPITEMVCVARQGPAHVQGGRGVRELNVPIHKLNPKVRPVYSNDVAMWLKAMGGENVDLLNEWLSHALTIDQPICALNLYGAPGSGKGMLAQGLAECFQFQRFNDGRALGKWNKGLLDSPIVFCDEGVPNLKSDESPSVDQAFRSIVSGGTITIRQMGVDPYTARMYPRILFMSNDPDIIRSIVGHRDLTQDDVRAIELRLLSMHVDGDAQVYLASRGNYKYTSGWIHGKSPSKYTLANHIMWLHRERRPSPHSSGRLLVEGQQKTHEVRSMRLRSKAAQAVLQALLRMVGGPKAKGVHINEGNVWVRPVGVKHLMDTVDGNPDRISLPQIGRVLRQFSNLDEEQTTKIEMFIPPGGGHEDRGRWFELDLTILLEEATRYGSETEHLKRTLRKQPDGEAKILRAEAQSI